MMGQPTKALGWFKTTRVTTAVIAPDWRNEKTAQNTVRVWTISMVVHASLTAPADGNGHRLASLEQCEIIEANVPV